MVVSFVIPVQNTDDKHRYMRPGVPHFVITCRNSLTIGGHFYNYEFADRTLSALLTTHHFGLHTTNAELTESFVYWFKSVSRLDVAMRILEECAEDENSTEDPGKLE